MRIYLNPGNQGFEEAIRSEIYADKTTMIRYTNSVLKTKKKYLCVSRPRRFGKTTTADMLSAYYGKSNSRYLFQDTSLAETENWDKYLNRFDVIRVVMTDFIKRKKDIESSLEKMQKLIVRNIKMQYPSIDYYDMDDLIQTMSDVYSQSGKQFIVIIDEWDMVFRERKTDRDGQNLYLDFLRDWLKDKAYIALAYITGILPIKKYGKHSALNMFDDYSMITPMQLASYTGFTDEEVKALCKRYGRNYHRLRHA